MRRFIGLFGGAFTVTCLLSVLVSARPRSVRPMPGWQPSALPHQKGVASPTWPPTPAPFRPELAKGESERRPQSDTSTVTVTCHPDYMEIAMDADLLGLGFPVALEDIRLGETQQTGDACRALPTEPGKYTIAAFLTDCGTEHVVSLLINLLNKPFCACLCAFIIFGCLQNLSLQLFFFKSSVLNINGV